MSDLSGDLPRSCDSSQVTCCHQHRPVLASCIHYHREQNIFMVNNRSQLPRELKILYKQLEPQNIKSESSPEHLSVFLIGQAELPRLDTVKELVPSP